MFLLELGSRREADAHLRDPDTWVLDNLNRLAQTDQDTLPVAKTLDHFLGHINPQAWAALRTLMIRRLIRMKALDGCRLDGYFMVAFDGTGCWVFHKRHCPHCLEQKHGNTTIYMHQVLEAKIVSPSGLALSIGTEFIENPSPQPNPCAASAQSFKQDCELKAASRLLPAIKRQFPQTPLCLTGDAEFACGRTIGLARDNGWQFFFTFKRGHMPALWDEFQSLLKLCPGNVLTLILPDRTRRIYRWAYGLSYTDDAGRTHTFNALQCHESKPDGETTLFAWITSFAPTRENADHLASCGGRIRWKIENQGFKAQKCSGMRLEHVYGAGPQRTVAYYLLLQIAHILWQVLIHGSLLARLAKSARTARTIVAFLGALKNLARRLLECLRNRFIPDEAFAPRPAIRIRLDTS